MDLQTFAGARLCAFAQAITALLAGELHLSPEPTPRLRVDREERLVLWCLADDEILQFAQPGHGLGDLVRDGSDETDDAFEDGQKVIDQPLGEVIEVDRLDQRHERSEDLLKEL